MRASLSPNLRSFALSLALLLLLLTISYSTAFAQEEGPSPYREFPVIGSRVAVWIAAQVHLMFAAFMLGVPMYALVVEYVGHRTGQKRYDNLAREFTKLILIARVNHGRLWRPAHLPAFCVLPGLHGSADRCLLADIHTLSAPCHV